MFSIDILSPYLPQKKSCTLDGSCSRGTSVETENLLFHATEKDPVLLEAVLLGQALSSACLLVMMTILPTATKKQ